MHIKLYMAQTCDKIVVMVKQLMLNSRGSMMNGPILKTLLQNHCLPLTHFNSGNRVLVNIHVLELIRSHKSHVLSTL